MDYDDLGLLTVKRQPNGVAIRQTYTPELRLHRITAILEKEGQAATEPFVDQRYAYNAAGHITAIAGLHGETSRYAYDPAGRLVEEQTRLAGQAGDGSAVATEFAYDALGNPLRTATGGAERRAAYNAANQLTRSVDAAGEWTYRYDRNGNRVAKYRLDPSAGTAALAELNAFDALNRLVSSTTASDVFAQACRGLAYHQSYRAEKHWTPGVDAPIERRTALVYDAQHELLTTTGNTTTQRVHGPNEELLQQITLDRASHTRTTQYPVANHQRSILAYTDADGAVIARHRYAAFGGEDTTTASAFDNAAIFHMYTGNRYFSGASPLINFRYRIYDSSTGLYLSRDPLLYEANPMGGIYEFCQNTPINLTDPFGLDANEEKCTCGPEIGAVLERLINTFRNDFRQLSLVERMSICHLARLNVGAGWEITELLSDGNGAITLTPECHSKGCENTVMVNGLCYKASGVNYVLWGALGAECDVRPDTTFAMGMAYTPARYIIDFFEGKYEPVLSAKLYWMRMGWVGAFSPPSFLDLTIEQVTKGNLLNGAFAPIVYNPSWYFLEKIANYEQCKKCIHAYTGGLTYRLIKIGDGNEYEKWFQKQVY